MIRHLTGAAGAIVFLCSFAHAGTLALDIVENPAHTGTVTTQSLGWEFQVNTPILIDGLAFWGSAVTQNHDVGIYNDTTQALLVSATVLTSDPSAGTGPWLVHSITPFLLNPGKYDIAAETGSDNYTSAPTSMSTIPQITFVADRFSFGSPVLAYPTDSSGGGLQAWFGPSFTATSAAVPEPAGFALFGAGLLSLAGLARRRRVR